MPKDLCQVGHNRRKYNAETMKSQEPNLIMAEVQAPSHCKQQWKKQATGSLRRAKRCRFPAWTRSVIDRLVSIGA
jgi:hypothetical protein